MTPGLRRAAFAQQSGFALIDTVLAVFITAVLIAPVMGGIFVVLRTAPGADPDAAVTGQLTANRQNFQLNLLGGELRDLWTRASIIKVQPADPDPSVQFSNDTGLDCQQGITSAALTALAPPSTGLVLAPYQNAGPVFSLQVPGDGDAAVTSSLTGLQLQGVGLTRVSYVLVTRIESNQQVLRADGSRVQDLVRRECVTDTSDGNPQPKVEGPGNVTTTCNGAGKIPADCKGWRLQPGEFNAPMGTWQPRTGGGAVVLSDVRTIDTEVRARTNGGSGPQSAAAASCNAAMKNSTSDTAYDHCDTTVTVTFGDGRQQKIRLYQGFGN